MLVYAPKLVRRIVDMKGSGSLADTKQIADFPRRLAFHRPAQGLEFAGRKGWSSRRRQSRRQYAERCILRVHSEQLQVGDDSRHSRRVLKHRAISIHSNDEVPPFWHVQGHGDSIANAEAGLLFPHWTKALV